MKKLCFIMGLCLIVSACGNFNDKQAVDNAYYKNTQSVAWPEKQKVQTQVKKVADKTAQAATKVAEKATTVSKTITTTTTTSETTTYTK